jgi:hypothetical protein
MNNEIFWVSFLPTIDVLQTGHSSGFKQYWKRVQKNVDPTNQFNDVLWWYRGMTMDECQSRLLFNPWAIELGSSILVAHDHFFRANPESIYQGWLIWSWHIVYVYIYIYIIMHTCMTLHYMNYITLYCIALHLHAYLHAHLHVYVHLHLHGTPAPETYLFYIFITWLGQKGVTLHTGLFWGNVGNSFKRGYYICMYSSVVSNFGWFNLTSMIAFWEECIQNAFSAKTKNQEPRFPKDSWANLGSWFLALNLIFPKTKNKEPRFPKDSWANLGSWF